MEIKRCARCGSFFASEIDVCQGCQKKDTADVNKLKGFLLEGVEEGVTRIDVAHSTGITMKNLNRYLNGSEFKGVVIPETKLDSKISQDDVVTKV